LYIEYDTSKFTTSGSFSGSILDPEYQYATLKFTPDGSNVASIDLPFVNDGWWSIQISKTGSLFTLRAANSIYNGSTGTEIGFIASSSVVGSISDWESADLSTFSPLNPQPSFIKSLRVIIKKLDIIQYQYLKVYLRIM
jgi:hypothetical protein